MARRKTRNPEAWQSKPGERGSNRFIQLYFPMMDSEAWKSLGPRARCLYTDVVKECWRGNKKCGPTFPDIPIQERGKSTIFYYTWSDARETGLYSECGERYFYEDRKELVKAGFIDDLAPHISRGNGKAKIYRFSSRWQSYVPSESKGAAK